MSRLWLIGLACLLAFVPASAFAQTASARAVASCGSQSYTAGQNYPTTQDLTGAICDNAGSSSSGSAAAIIAAIVAGYVPVPVPVTPNALTAVAGTQRGLAIASATSLTIPTGATTALIQAQGTNNTSGVCLFWQDDGTAPTNAAGQSMAAGGSMFYKVSTLPIQLIAASGASCTATISYYK